jgi:uncharacterized protein (TIGR02147 family)
MASWIPDIFEYLDYRKFLTDYYEAAKENIPGFSYRWFAKRAGYTSPNFLKLVMDGQRNLGAESVDRFADVLKFTQAQRTFFTDLVAFDQADTPEDKNAAFERLAASRRFRNARRIESAYFEYLSRWYYPAIREMVARTDFQEDAEWIARELLPPIPVAQVREALERLLELGLVCREEGGRLTRGDPSITTGHEVRSLAVGNYHRQMLQRAAESIELVPREQRDISALTVCVRAELVPDLKARIHAFREVLLEVCDRDTQPEVVYQINLQLFPLTQPPKSG